MHSRCKKRDDVCVGDGSEAHIPPRQSPGAWATPASSRYAGVINAGEGSRSGCVDGPGTSPTPGTRGARGTGAGHQRADTTWGCEAVSAAPASREVSSNAVRVWAIVVCRDNHEAAGSVSDVNKAGRDSVAGQKAEGLTPKRTWLGSKSRKLTRCATAAAPPAAVLARWCRTLVTSAVSHTG